MPYTLAPWELEPDLLGLALERPIAEHFAQAAAAQAPAVPRWTPETYPFRQFVQEAWPQVENRPLIWHWGIEAYCDHLQATYAGTIQRLLLNLPPRFAKPIDVNAVVLMRNGQRKRLGDIAVGESVITHLGRPQQVTAVHEQGMLPTVRLTTFRGRTVIAAPDHPFLTPEGWIAAQDLRLGQCLAAVPLPRYTADQHDRHDAEFALAGYFVGDGSVGIYNGNVHATITSVDAEYQDEVKRCAEVLGFGLRVSQRQHITELSLKGKVRDWLRDIGLAGQKSATKRVPAFVFQGTPAQIGQYIAAYFHCDGSAYKAKNRQHYRLEFSSISKGLLEDTQHLLLRLGIHGTIFKHVATKDTTYAPAGYVSWKLAVSRADDVAKFFTTIPVLGRKQRRIQSYDPLRTAFDMPFFADPVVAIEDAGIHDCRCLTVENDASFTVNDLVVHNSVVFSVLFHPWVWIMDPTLRFVFFSYSKDLSLRDAGKARALIQSPWYQERWHDRVRLEGPGRLSRYTNTAGGFRFSSSVGGMGTGEGGDFLCGDDLHNAKEEESETRLEIEAAKAFWFNVASTRVASFNTSREIVCGQRIAIDDISAQILTDGTHVHLSIPMEYAPDEETPDAGGDDVQALGLVEVMPEVPNPLGFTDPRTQPGELLCPALMNADAVAFQKKRLQHKWHAQFQQRPQGKASTLFPKERWRFFHEWPDAEALDLVIQSWDLRFKEEKDRGSFVAGHVWGRKGAMLYLLDRVHERFSFPETQDAIAAMSTKWPMAHGKLVENKANGPAILQSLRVVVAGLVPVDPTWHGSKYSRAEAIAYIQQSGNVWLPHPTLAPWVTEYVQHMYRFPAPPSDDTDATSQAWQRLFRPVLATDPRKVEEAKRAAERQRKLKALREQRSSWHWTRTGA